MVLRFGAWLHLYKFYRNSAAAGQLIIGCRAVCVWLLCMLPLSGFALDRKQAELIPHVNQQARENFIQYIYASDHKAFAIAPGGSWAWVALEGTVESARRAALERCQSHTQQSCVLYSVNDQVVFDAQAWPRLWRPYSTATQAATLQVGMARGARFPNLSIKDRKGEPSSIAAFKGKVTIVHFWGSWCAPCLREMPLLLQLKKELDKNPEKIKMVLLQAREPFSQSLQWAKKNQFDTLPLYDSGISDEEDDTMATVEGQSFKDRTFAKVFPTTYVLDRNGVVLFSHNGPMPNWLEYLPFLNDAAQHKPR